MSDQKCMLNKGACVEKHGLFAETVIYTIPYKDVWVAYNKAIGMSCRIGIGNARIQAQKVPLQLLTKKEKTEQEPL